MLDLHPVLGNIIGFVVAGIILAATMRTTLKHVQAEVQAIKTEVSELGKILSVVAVQSNRLDTIDKRLDGHDAIIDDLRRGEGFIMPPPWRTK